MAGRPQGAFAQGERVHAAARRTEPAAPSVCRGKRSRKNYVFDGPRGKETLADLFGGRSQLIVYHFMFGPGWKEGCPSCSFLADGFDGAAVHLAHRDVTFLAISRATLPEIDAFKKRMGWKFKWVSSFGNEFNYDYHVSFSNEERAKGKVYYNYDMIDFPSEEAPGTSVFYKNGAGEIFHTYSSFARGLDPMIRLTTGWISRPKGGTKRDWALRWPGYGIMTNTWMGSGRREGDVWRLRRLRPHAVRKRKTPEGGASKIGNATMFIQMRRNQMATMMERGRWNSDAERISRGVCHHQESAGSSSGGQTSRGSRIGNRCRWGSWRYTLRPFQGALAQISQLNQFDARRATFVHPTEGCGGDSGGVSRKVSGTGEEYLSGND